MGEMEKSEVGKRDHSNGRNSKRADEILRLF